MFDNKYNSELLSKQLWISLEQASEISGQVLSPKYTRRLYRRAKTLSRVTLIPFHKALDAVARSEGYSSWEHVLECLKEFSIYKNVQIIRRNKVKGKKEREYLVSRFNEQSTNLCSNLGKISELTSLTKENHFMKTTASNSGYISSFIDKALKPEDSTPYFIRGEVVTGKVVMMRKKWALVLVGNKMASVSYSKLAWRYVFNPSDYIRLGGTYEFISLRNTRGEKGVLSLRRYQDNEWQELKAKLHVGDKYKARVVRVRDKNILFLLPGLDVVSVYTMPTKCQRKYRTGDIYNVVIKVINFNLSSYDGGLSVYVASF